MNMGLFYGSSTCYTEMAAEKIRDILGPELVTLHNLKDDAPALMEQYDVLILGIPTWDFGEIQEDWEAVWEQLDDLNLEGKIVALYGMGDQLGYGEWFLDALGMLHDKLALKGVNLSATGPQKATNLPAINRSLRMGNCLSAWRWMKRTSTISAMSVYRPGVNKFSAKWPNTTPEALLAVFPSRRNRVYAVPSVLA